MKFIDKSQMRIRPAFLWCLLGCFLFALILPLILPDRNSGMRARIVNTKYDEKQIASALNQQATETVGLTNIDNGIVFQSVFNVLRLNYGSERTNSQGEILDIWKMPFQIEITPPTNFVVRSAGPDKKFGDPDDIVFNSASNDFVKP
jgi:hypothetical protein